MRPRPTAISALLAAALAAPAWAQDKEWGQRPRLDGTGKTARTESVICPVCECKCERGVYERVTEYEWDTDFKVMKASFNVYPYVLVTCPKCNYSTYSAQFHKALTTEQKKDVFEALEEVRKEYPDSWSVPLSVTLRAAAITQKALNSGEGTLFEIYLLGSYLARDAAEAEAERDMQRRAVENLAVAIEKDEYYQRPRMRYLAGELYRRLGQYKEALDWFGKARQDAPEDLTKLIQQQEMRTRDEMDKKKRK